MVIDFFIIHRGLEGWCQEATVFKEGYSAPHRPVEMLIKGQQVQGSVSVHKRPPALMEPMVHGPFRHVDGRLTAASHEVTAFANEFQINFDGPNKTQVMTEEVNTRLTTLFGSWYHWAEAELEQRLGFEHTPEQDIEVKEVERRSLLPTQVTARPMPSAALRFMRDRLHDARGASWLQRSNRSRYKTISPNRIMWLEVHLKGQHADVLRCFQKC